jgi:hypothetical protein
MLAPFICLAALLHVAYAELNLGVIGDIIQCQSSRWFQPLSAWRNMTGEDQRILSRP